MLSLDDINGESDGLLLSRLPNDVGEIKERWAAQRNSKSLASPPPLNLLLLLSLFVRGMSLPLSESLLFWCLLISRQ
jgi:hypothetical protein